MAPASEGHADAGPDEYGLSTARQSFPGSDEPDGYLSRELSREAIEETQAVAAATHTDMGPPPDGGTRAWLAVFAASGVLLTVFGFVTSMGQLQTYYLDHQLKGYAKSTVAWIGSMQAMLTYGGSLLAGRAFDAYGPQKLMWIGTTLLTGSLVAVAFCHEYYQFLLAHMLFGIGGTIVYSPSTAISGHWFARRRGTAVSVTITGAGVGGVIYPIMMRELFVRLSFRNTMLIVAAFTFVFMVPACTVMRARLPRRKPPPWRILAEPWREVRYVCLVLGAALWLMNVFAPYFNAPVLAATNMLSPEVTSYSIAILQAGSLVGRLIVGPIADRVGIWTTFGTVSLMSSISVFAFWTGRVGGGGAIAGMVLYGMASGAWMTMVTAATGSISPVTQIGMRIGMLWTVGALPNMVGPVICGALISTANGRFTYAGIFTGFTMLLGACVMVGPAVASRWRSRYKTSDQGYL